MSKIDDIEIINRVINGEVEAYSHIINKYQNMVFKYVYYQFNNYDEALDLTQDIFIIVLEALPSFRQESKFSTWLYRIATNETLTFLAAKRMKNINSLDEVEDVLLQNLKADSYFNGDETQLQLQKAILALPEKQRLVFNMRFYDDLKYEEMSEVLGTSVGALKASYHHATKKIEQILTGKIED